jgi:oxidoreductase
MEKTPSELKAVVIGASGAIGRELVDCLIESGKWSEITLITRRKISRWESLPLSTTIKFVLIEDLDILKESKETLIKTNPELNFEGYSTVFNCLGSRTKHGETEFKKVDYYYVIYSAQLCKKFNIPHFSHVTSVGSNKNSCFLYMRVKGEVEEKLKTMDLDQLSIFRPGALMNRDNDSRCGECFLACLTKICCCFLSAIDCKQVAQGLVYDAENVSKKNEKSRVYENSKIIELSNESTKTKVN